MKATRTIRSGTRTTHKPLGEVMDLLRLLWELDHALHRRSQSMVKELGVTGPQRLVLRLVGRFPGIPAGELSALLHVHPSTVTDIVQRLERGGWLRRRVDARDRRCVLLGLTERGRLVDGAESDKTIEEGVRRVLERLPAAQVDAARIVLSALARELSE